MNTKIDSLIFKLATMKKMLEEAQDDLDIDYRVEGTLQEIIDVCDEVIIICTAISTDKEKL